jgi:hypothetical protein
MIAPTPAAEFPARAYSLPWRVAAGLLVALSHGSLPLLLALVLLATDPPIGPILLVQLVALFALLPALAAACIGRVGAARVERGAADLIVRRADLQVEIPTDAIARLAVWAVPLPGPGVTLWLRSGKRLRYVLQLDDPAPLLHALGGAAAHAALDHPTVVYAHAAAAAPRWRWYHYGWKYALFALAPTAVFFNAHQHIAYGGPLGEYHLLGLTAYLRTFAVYWVTLAIHLVLFASLWRGAAEAASLGAAWAAPSRAARVRRGAERCCQVFYYAGVPALVALRFLA